MPTIIFQHEQILASLIGGATGPASITYVNRARLLRRSRRTGIPLRDILPPHPVDIFKVRTEMAWLGDYNGIIESRRCYYLQGRRLVRGGHNWGEHVSPNIIRHTVGGRKNLYIQFLLNVNHNPMATPTWIDDDGDPLPDDLARIIAAEYEYAGDDPVEIARRQGLNPDRVVLCRRVHLEGVASIRADGRNYQRRVDKITCHNV